MASCIQRLYWHSPAFVKNTLASLNARTLDRQRHGPWYDRWSRLIADHDEWSLEQFEEYQSQQLMQLVEHAATRVPYYRQLFAEKRIDPRTIRDIASLQQVPILEKQTVRENPTDFLDESLDRRTLTVMHTSGTTGTPLTLYRDDRLNAAAFAFYDCRFRGTFGLSRRYDKSVTFGGHLVTDPRRHRPPFWVYNRRWRQLYMSSYHLSSRWLDDYVRALWRFGGDYIEGYPSSIYAVARHIIDRHLASVPFKACFTTAENLFDFQREAIQQAFGCASYTQYGCGEVAVFAAQCREGSMHLSPEIGIVEVVDEHDNPLPAGKVGTLICTSLVNRAQPFIRYRVGDRGSLRPGRCPCGCVLPMLGQIEGRVDEVLLTRDGRRIGRLDPVFKGVRGMVEAQVIQDDDEHFRVRFVPASNYRDADGQNVVTALSERLGGCVTITLEPVDRIERTPAGKFKAIIRNMSIAGIE